MATLRNKRTLAVVSRETQEHTRNSHSQNTSIPGSTEKYITQISEEIEGRVTKKLSHEYIRRTESCILGGLYKLDEFIPNPQTRTLSATVRRTSRNNDLEWYRNNDPEHPGMDRSQSDPYPEVEFSTRRTSNWVDSDQEETSRRNCYTRPLRVGATDADQL